MHNKRRKFLKQGATALSSALVLPNLNHFAIITNSPNETVRIGVIGTGDRGQGLMKILNQIQNIELVAICDTLPFRLEAASNIAPKAKTYSDHKALLNQKDLKFLPALAHLTLQKNTILLQTQTIELSLQILPGPLDF